jgi:hypothetical protein
VSLVGVAGPPGRARAATDVPWVAPGPFIGRLDKEGSVGRGQFLELAALSPTTSVHMTRTWLWSALTRRTIEGLGLVHAQC